MKTEVTLDQRDLATMLALVDVHLVVLPAGDWLRPHVLELRSKLVTLLGFNPNLQQMKSLHELRLPEGGLMQ